MSIEAHGYEREPDSVEFAMVADSLRSHFREAVLEQKELADTKYRMFTIVDRSSGFSHDLARFRVVDALMASDNLQNASQESVGYLDVALPIVSPDPISPELVTGAEGDYFVFYNKTSDQEDETTLVTPLNIIGFLSEHPGFLTQTLLSEVIPLRKT